MLPKQFWRLLDERLRLQQQVLGIIDVANGYRLIQLFQF